MSSVDGGGASLRVLPIGGCGEVGLNATLLVDGDDALLIDCGVLLGIQDAPGVDSAIPDFEPLRTDGRRLAGVVLTHGHEDHIGGIPWLLEELDEVTVYGPPLAIRLLEHRLEAEPSKRARLVAVPLGQSVRVGPFLVELIRVTHSLPDSAALYIETRAGRVLHSGDYKLDPIPIDGRATDVERLKSLGDRGLDLVLADSTNSERPGRTKPEQHVGLELERLIAEAHGRVVVSCFASHLHRIQGIARAAAASGRKIALLGRALQETWRIGIAEGHLKVDSAMLVDERRIADIPARELVLIATGSQGESRAALSRISRGLEPALIPRHGDRFILSSMTIPGNETAVRRIVNDLARAGAEVVDDRARAVHCSGHAHKEEQADLLRMLRPRHFVPVHGERTMLAAHARTAVECGVPEAAVMVIEDGESVVLAGGTLSRGPAEPVSPQPVDGGSGALIEWEEIGDRRKLGFGGLVVCSVALSATSHRMLGEPAVSISGIPAGKEIARAVAGEVSNALEVLKGRGAGTDRKAAIKSAIRRAISRYMRIRPVERIHILEVKTGD